jgi:hypothetical protein
LVNAKKALRYSPACVLAMVVLCSLMFLASNNPIAYFVVVCREWLLRSARTQFERWKILRPKISNFCCLPGRAVGSPNGLVPIRRQREKISINIGRLLRKEGFYGA